MSRGSIRSIFRTINSVTAIVAYEDGDKWINFQARMHSIEEWLRFSSLQVGDAVRFQVASTEDGLKAVDLEKLTQSETPVCKRRKPIAPR